MTAAPVAVEAVPGFPATPGGVVIGPPIYIPTDIAPGHPFYEVSGIILGRSVDIARTVLCKGNGITCDKLPGEVEPAHSYTGPNILTTAWILTKWHDPPWMNSSSDRNDESDRAIDDLVKGLPSELDSRGRPKRGHYVDTDSSAQDRLNGLPGESRGEQKILPDGSVAGIHVSTTTGVPTIQVGRPRGKQDIKVRYPRGGQ